MKKVAAIILKSTVATFLVVAILLLTHKFTLDQIELLIMKAKGTSNLEGEEKGTEIWNIFFGIIAPCTFVAMICLFTIFRLRKGPRQGGFDTSQ
jgi:hypothetical protein